MRRCVGHGFGGGKRSGDGGQSAAPARLDPQHLGFGFDIKTGGEPGKLSAAPVDMGAVDQLALAFRRRDGLPDLRIADFAKPDAPGFLVQGGS